MNKTLIKKYKSEFEHWLNGGEILHKRINSLAWYTKDCWSDQVSIVQAIIINDKYVKFRKALAEGKQIQVDINYWAFPETYTKNYQDLPITFTDWNKYSVECYRIKPEEPKFNVGDWVIDKKQKHKPFMVTSSHLETDSPNYVKLDCEFWQPKLNDWCWFYDVPHYDMPVLQKFVTTIGNYYIALNDFKSKHTNLESVPSCEKGISDSYNRWKYCEPFLGTLPSTLKNYHDKSFHNQ